MVLKTYIYRIFFSTHSKRKKLNKTIHLPLTVNKQLFLIYLSRFIITYFLYDLLHCDTPTIFRNISSLLSAVQELIYRINPGRRLEQL